MTSKICIFAKFYNSNQKYSIHFRRTAKMEGCHTALPIFGIFMTKVYKDPLTKITKGRFPKAILDLGKTYYCPTPWEKKDTSKDSSDEGIATDSIGDLKKPEK